MGNSNTLVDESSFPSGANRFAPSAVDVFVVETALQLLNAIEAHHYFNCQRSILLIVLHDASRKAQFQRFLAKFPPTPWGAVHFVLLKSQAAKAEPGSGLQALSNILRDKGNELYQLLNRRRLEKQLASIPTHGRVFLGNYLNVSKSYFRHAANFIKASRIVLLDDGTDAIVVNGQRIERLQPRSDPAPSRGSGKWAWFAELKTAVRRRHVDWDDRHEASVTFFSAYRLTTAETDRLIPNSYQLLRSRKATQRSGDDVYILGQSLVEDGYLRLEDYVRNVVNLCRLFELRRIVYIPHRREAAETVDRVANATGVRVNRSDMPIEYALLTAAELPSVVASFFCSALVNCGVIFGDSITCVAYRIDPNLLLVNPREVLEVYETIAAMQSPHFQIIDCAVPAPKSRL